LSIKRYTQQNFVMPQTNGVSASHKSGERVLDTQKNLARRERCLARYGETAMNQKVYFTASSIVRCVYFASVTPRPTLETCEVNVLLSVVTNFGCTRLLEL